MQERKGVRSLTRRECYIEFPTCVPSSRTIMCFLAIREGIIHGVYMNVDTANNDLVMSVLRGSEIVCT